MVQAGRPNRQARRPPYPSQTLRLVLRRGEFRPHPTAPTSGNGRRMPVHIFACLCHRPFPVKYFRLFFLLAAWFVLAGQSIAALQVGTSVWGFDGGVLPWSFNLVSI